MSPIYRKKPQAESPQREVETKGESVRKKKKTEESKREELERQVEGEETKIGIKMERNQMRG